MITQIYLDLDDVLNAFTMFALKKVGCPVEAFDFHLYKPEWGFDIVKAANELHPDSPCFFTEEYFWSLIGRDVWRNTPESMEFKWLLRKCEELVGRSNICILTTPIDDPECLAGKLEWIHDHLPRWMRRQYLIGPQKYLLAKPGALLIDDSDENIEAFRPHGGQAILVPRPWNRMHDLRTAIYLKYAFIKIQYE